MSLRAQWRPLFLLLQLLLGSYQCACAAAHPAGVFFWCLVPNTCNPEEEALSAKQHLFCLGVFT